MADEGVDFLDSFSEPAGSWEELVFIPDLRVRRTTFGLPLYWNYSCSLLRVSVIPFIQ